MPPIVAPLGTLPRANWRTVVQTAARLKVSTAVVRRWIRAGRLPARKFSLPDGQALVLVPADAPRPARIVKDPRV